MNFNPKKLKRTEVKLFSFITSYINLIDYVVILFVAITSIIFIIYMPLAFWVSLNTILYTCTFLFILKFNNQRIVYLFWKYIYFRFSIEKNIQFPIKKLIFPEEDILGMNEKFYIGIIFNLDYELNNDSSSDKEIKIKFDNFLYNLNANILIFNTSLKFKDVYPELYEQHRFNSEVKSHIFVFEFINIKFSEEFLNQININFASNDYEILSNDQLENLFTDYGITGGYKVKFNPSNIEFDNQTLYLKTIIFRRDEVSSDIKKILSNNSILYLKKLPQSLAIKRIKNDLSFSRLGLNSKTDQLKSYEDLMEDLAKENEILFDLGIVILDQNHKKIKNKFLWFDLNLFKQNTLLNKINNFNIDTGNYLTGNNFKVIQDFSSSSIVNDISGYLIGFNQENRPIYFDPTFKNDQDRINSNHLIMGMSGSGKSYLMKRYLSIIEQMHKNYLVLDAEQEYLINENNEQTYIKFNLMFIMNCHIYFDLPKANYLSIIYEIWEGLVESNLDDVIHYFENLYMERIILTNILMTELIERFSIRLNSTFISLLDEDVNIPHTFSQNEKIQIIFDIKEFLEISKFSSYTTKLFDRTIIFALSNFINLFDGCNDDFAIFFDEFHLFLNANNELIIYITQLVKQIRKRKGMLFLSTQNLIDFKGNNQFIIQTIMNNCNYYYFSKMMSTDIIEFSNLMKNSYFISLTTIKQIEKLERGEFLFTIQTKRYEIIKIY